jgi:hypothetical protein
MAPAFPTTPRPNLAWDAFAKSVVRPTVSEHLSALVPLGLQQPGDVESRLGYYVGPRS